MKLSSLPYPRFHKEGRLCLPPSPDYAPARPLCSFVSLLSLLVCLACLACPKVGAQPQDPLLKPFGKKMSVFHLTWTSTYSDAGGYKRDDYMLWDDTAYDPKTNTLKTWNGDGEFSNKATKEGGPYDNLKAACDGSAGNAKLWAALGCPGPPPESKPGLGTRIAGWFFPSKQRFSEGWEAMTGSESGKLERVAGGASLLGAGCEVALTLMGVVSLWKWGLKAVGWGAAKEAAAEVATGALTPAVEAAMANAEYVASKALPAAQNAMLGKMDLYVGQHIEDLLRAMGKVRQAGWTQSLKNPELVRNLIDPNHVLSAAQNTELLQLIEQRISKLYFGGY